MIEGNVALFLIKGVIVAGHLRAASAQPPERTSCTRGWRALPNRKGASKIAR
ncbi:hypothetical protein YPPY15_4612 [Yersinia pestis PY-15]|nr:hypothetical protein YPIP275_4658 [Yersinia pestis biovar Orientalis str. IP275]EDR39214.1 hypothetical protein YpF1991016_2300 [Yersinia pestis biovar Orientalis str. F1991016]EDR43870.1 hypothetical protein YpE1979001_3679 [Yersinia pestis biovar Antiqua str. E1979001]EDR50049.1 hypothetical protein YpB42003004_3814 [Yersinia pestis biovar Antiqua str. B42003004]EDR55263.1 hypothetical protein YpMG051020_2874 [Yersinia pestis biovar Orientalis str. MG05-1020]EDR65249.1 hypothetical protei